MRQETVLVALVVASALVFWAGTAAATDHSGTVMTVDREHGTIVVGEVGPWQIRGGRMVITKRTIAVSPTTQVVASRRAREPGPTGWPGEFVDVTLDRWAVKEGDFVTVHVEKDGERPTATKITVTATEGG